MDHEPRNKRQHEDATNYDELYAQDQSGSAGAKSNGRQISATRGSILDDDRDNSAGSPAQLRKPYDAHKESSRADRVAGSPASDISEQRRRNDLGITSPLTHPNGISMFPDMSVTEQEAMSRQALAQAEENIVADSDEYNSADDAGYGSDNMSSASTSIGSSVRDYMFENGRRYHSFRAGAYNFPNDDVEQEREDMKHAMVRLLSGQKLHFAPLGDNPQNILDIGTGTGIWAIEMGEQYPSANVLGIDLSPIQPTWLPPNVHFMVDDVESSWLHPQNHFDYIHSRHTVQAVKDWPRLFESALQHMKPGGWMELQEIHHYPHNARTGEAIHPYDHPIAQYWTYINEGLAALGVDFPAAAGGKLATKMHAAGFVNVTERIFHVPLGTWPKNQLLKTVGLYWRTILNDGVQAIALGPMSRGMGWSREQIEVFLVSVRRAYCDNTALLYMPMHIVYGQKPH
ncbi:S-adenosyl-L-methionine-dependent methyltransferase [Fusarium flagelliforme]|uniref:S-adenosyl-L-methionine-dependent methyltransferase n=1 Tax=Fusarium flagelliforme TaxID=2675880 RepID=UPI001E8DDEAD|nr:S-adenosyl-L-methionine-dependent methyltransferase [Fusarium flagelliforme]KAH7185492.1 S-adenosyl-L-methionine-dependent methyltransferase [Fusarium flagelliforme]